MTENLPARQDRPPPVKVDLTKPIADLDEALRLADALAKSELVPLALYGKPANILHVLVTGQEMGLKWPVSLRTIYAPSRGQIGVRGQLLLAKLREAGHDYSWEEGPDFCKFTLVRDGATDQPGRSYTATFTTADAIRAGLAEQREGQVVARSREGKAMPWMQYTPRMLFWRAVADCVNRAAPEVLLGFEIQGAEAPAEPQPEVVLKPGQPETAPPPQAASGGGAQAEELTELDRQMRERLGGPAQTSDDSHSGDGGPAQDHDGSQAINGGPAEPGPQDREPENMGGNAADDAVSAEAGSATAEATADGEPEDAAGKAKGQLLAGQFEALGWHPRRHRADVLRACTMFLRRPVSSVRDMDTAEILRLASALSAIQRTFEPGHYPVALADAVETWRAAWETADPAGYAEAFPR